LAEADAFASLGYDRRNALWAAKAIRSPKQLPLFAGDIDGEGIVEPTTFLPATTEGEEVVEDYVSTRLSLRAHPMGLLRPQLGPIVTAKTQMEAADGTSLSLADETGVANVVVWTRVYERFRRAVISGRLLRVTGKLQREGDPPHAVTHLIAWQIEDLSPMLDQLGHVQGRGGAICDSNARADEAKRPVANRKPHQPRARHPREQAKVLFPSRDFH